MTIICNHKYEKNEISFEIEHEGQKRWVNGSDFNDDHSIIQKYFEERDKQEKEKMSKEKSSSTWALSQATIPPPTNILEIVKIDGVSHVLCKFDTLDTPVYVPTRFLTNAYPSILIKYFEDQIMKSPEDYE